MYPPLPRRWGTISPDSSGHCTEGSSCWGVPSHAEQVRDRGGPVAGAHLVHIHRCRAAQAGHRRRRAHAHHGPVPALGASLPWRALLPSLPPPCPLSAGPVPPRPGGAGTPPWRGCPPSRCPPGCSWEGTHCRWTRRAPEASPTRWSHTATPSGELCAGGPARSEASADWLFVQMTTGSSSSALSTSQRRAAISCSSPPGLITRAPAPPSFTPPSAEHLTRSGSRPGEGCETLFRRSLPCPRGRSHW